MGLAPMAVVQIPFAHKHGVGPLVTVSTTGGRVLLISASKDGIRRWDAVTGTPLGHYPDSGSLGAFDLVVAAPACRAGCPGGSRRGWGRLLGRGDRFDDAGSAPASKEGRSGRLPQESCPMGG